MHHLYLPLAASPGAESRAAKGASLPAAHSYRLWSLTKDWACFPGTGVYDALPYTRSTLAEKPETRRGGQHPVPRADSLLPRVFLSFCSCRMPPGGAGSQC